MCAQVILRGAASSTHIHANEQKGVPTVVLIPADAHIVDAYRELVQGYENLYPGQRPNNLYVSVTPAAETRLESVSETWNKFKRVMATYPDKILDHGFYTESYEQQQN